MTNQRIAVAGATVIAIAGLVFGAARVLPKQDIPAVPEAKKSALVEKQEIVGARAILIVVEDGTALGKLAGLFTFQTKQRQGKYGLETYRTAVFDGNDVSVFFAVPQSKYATLFAGMNFPFSGGVVFPDDAKDAEERMIEYMHQQGIKLYEVITI